MTRCQGSHSTIAAAPLPHAITRNLLQVVALALLLALDVPGASADSTGSAGVLGPTPDTRALLDQSGPPLDRALPPELQRRAQAAFTAFQQGSLQQAARDYAKLLEDIDAAGLPEERRLALKAMTLMPLVVIYDSLGLTERARRSLEQARALAADAKDPRLALILPPWPARSSRSTEKRRMTACPRPFCRALLTPCWAA